MRQAAERAATIRLTEERKNVMMKEFLEDLGKRISETADSVGKKTEQMLEVQKIKGQIREIERNSEKDLADIGRILYERYKSSAETDSELSVICEEIEKREKLMKALEKRLAKARGVVVCTACHADVEPEMRFCPHCGKEMEEEKPEETAAADTEEDIFVEEGSAETADACETAEASDNVDACEAAEALDNADEPEESEFLDEEDLDGEELEEESCLDEED